MAKRISLDHIKSPESSFSIAHLLNRIPGLTSVLLILFCLIIAVNSGCSDRSESMGELRIGLLADLPTPGGRPTVNAAQLAIAQVNAEGGVTVDGRRYRLALVVRDTQNNPTTAMEAARELIYQKKIVGLIGPNISRNAIPVANIAEQARVPMVSPGSTSPATTDGKSFAFRVAVVDEVQGEVMADFAIDHLRARRAGILYDVANPSNKSVGEVFARAFAERGGTVASRHTYTTGERDFEDSLQSMKDADLDVLFLPNRTEDVQRQAQRARQLGIDAVFLGSDAWSPHKLRGIDAIEGAYFGHHWHQSMKDVDDDNRRFVDAYQLRFGELPAVMSALTYDSVGIMVRALRQSKSIASTAVRDSLANAEPYNGLTGRSVFRGTGNPFKNALILHCRSDEVHFFKTIKRVAHAF